MDRRIDGCIDMTVIVVIMNKCLTDVRISVWGKARKYEDGVLSLCMSESSTQT